MRYFLAAVFSLFAISFSVAQTLPSGMSQSQAIQLAQGASDDQLLGYISLAKNQGYSLEELKTLMTAQGASGADMAKLDRLWNQSGDTTSSASENQNEVIQSNFGKTPFSQLQYQMLQQQNPYSQLFGQNSAFANLGGGFLSNQFIVPSKRFGMNFFEIVPENNEIVPELYLATPIDYTLGPGDQLVVQIYGSSESTYNLQVSREGTVKIDRLAPVFLSGLSFLEAEKVLIKSLSNIYEGLSNASNNASAKVSLDLSLKKARSIVVNVTGFVKAPGAYTISGFSSILNVLFAAGGPNEVGSFRKIKVLRGGKLIETVDLYDFFVSGKYPSIYLQDQDVIQVPGFEAQVTLEGAFKTSGSFELLDGETLEHVLRFSGGFDSNAYKKSVFVSRINEFRRESETIDIQNASLLPLKDGDIISANLVRASIENTVSIEGEVYVPGNYSLNSVTSIKDLIGKSQGLTPSALKSRAILYRNESGVEQVSSFVDLTTPSSLDLELKNGDRLIIPSVSDLSDFGQIQVLGEVNAPGVFSFRKGMTIGDAVLLANGFSSLANTNNVEVYRNSSFSSSNKSTNFSIQFDSNLIPNIDLPLMPDDLIVVREYSGYRPLEQVVLSGSVRNKGVYIIKNDNYRLYDLLVESGGFLPNANLSGIQVKRRVLADQVTSETVSLAIKEEGKDDMNGTTDQLISDVSENTVIIGIDGEKLMASNGNETPENIVIQEGDVIFVPQIDNTITLVGGVQQTTKFTYRNALTLNQAIRRAGGYSETARKSKVYVVYQNGTIKPRRHFLGIFRNDPSLASGATVVVPIKEEKKSASRSAGELIGIATSLGSLALLIQNVLSAQ